MDSLEMVRELARILRSEGLEELDYESGEVRVRLVSRRKPPCADQAPDGAGDPGRPTP